jgi:hypothetical protein
MRILREGRTICLGCHDYRGTLSRDKAAREEAKEKEVKLGS